jgi:hypothetical protein
MVLSFLMVADNQLISKAGGISIWGAEEQHREV